MTETQVQPDLASRPHESDVKNVVLKEVIKGSEQPRIFTPPLRPLTPETSDGFACIAFAQDVLGFRLLPWQKWMLIHALELRRDGLYRFRQVVCLVARQNGKTLVMQILALWHMFAKNSKYILSTAQDLSNSEKAWMEALTWAKENDEMAGGITHEIFQRGQKEFNLLPDYGGGKWYVKSANRKSGRGFSNDLVLLDEVREHTNFECWAAVGKTIRARAHAQVWCFSNAGEMNSVVLRHLRALGHRDLDWPDGELDTESLDLPDMSEFEAEFAGDGEGGIGWDDDEENSLGYFEYSADPRYDRSDIRGWAQANPSLNWTEIVRDVVTTRIMKGDYMTDPPGVFDTECLCRWVPTTDKGPFHPGDWEDTQPEEAKFEPNTERWLGVEVNWDRTFAYIARVGPLRDHPETTLLDIAAARAGVDWVVPWLVQNRDRYTGVVVRSTGAPVSSLLDYMKAEDLPKQSKTGGEELSDEESVSVIRNSPFLDELAQYKLPIVLCYGDDLGRASGMMYDKLRTKKLLHLAHPQLDAAAKTAKVKVLRDWWTIDMRGSPTDAAPLVAAIGALWGKERFVDEETQIPDIHTFAGSAPGVPGIEDIENKSIEQVLAESGYPSNRSFW